MPRHPSLVVQSLDEERTITNMRSRKPDVYGDEASDLRKLIRRGEVWVRIRWVNTDGDRRSISFYVVSKGRIRKIDREVAVVLNAKLIETMVGGGPETGVECWGVGLDMSKWPIMILSRWLYDDDNVITARVLW